MDSTLPESKHQAVQTALRAAFDVDAPEELRPLTGGMSKALVYRIVVGGRPYLLRMITKTDAYADPTREFTAMQAAADAGIAPRIDYASIADRLLVTDFVEARPFPADVIPAIAPVLHRLHALPPFVKVLDHQISVIDGFIQRCRAAQLPVETSELFDRYAELAQVYPRTADLVACHNDLKPQNTLFDGQRFWLVDWEAAFLNDRYVDLSIVANFFVAEADEERFLATYFGEPLGEARRAQFFLMQQAEHVFYATCFLLLAAREGATLDAEAPDFRAFHAGLIAGAIDLQAADAKLRYAKVHIAEGLRQMRSPRFAQALAAV